MVDRSVRVRLKGDVSDFNRAMIGGAVTAKAFTRSLDASSDRMSWLVQSSLALGPALVPIGAAAIPAISGLTNQLAFAAVGAGVAALAFSGVGDALKSVNDYQLEPTAANFEKMRETMATLGPAGRDFVVFLQGLRPELQKLQDLAQEGLLPGAQEGITELMELLPQAERIVSVVATSLGDLIAEAGDNLNDPRWQEFFTFLENEARPTLIDMGRTLGNFTEGFANLWMAFDPVSDNFSKSFLQLSRDFAEWTDGLDQTQGFQEFVDYITRIGPKAWDTLGALGNALLQIVEAAAPVGEVMLPVIATLADVLASIADSPVGPVLIGAAAGISAISRAVALYNVANGSAMAGFLTRAGGAGAGMRVAAAGVGIFALSMTDLDEKMGLSNTAMFAMLGAVAGPWGAAIGAGVGLTMDFAAANDDLWAAIDRANSVLSDNSSSLDQQASAVDAARQKLDDLKESIDGTLGSWSVAGQKNFYEGLFGSSDVEEAEAALAALEAQQAKNIVKAQEQQFADAGMSEAMRGASQSTRDQTQALLNNIDALNAARDAKLAAANSEIAYEQAIDDAAKAAREGTATLDINTQAGRDNNTALLRLAGAWNDLEPAVQRASGASERARGEFIKAAMQMGATRKEAERLADKYLDIPSKVSTSVRLNGVGSALGQLATLQHRINSLTGKTVGIHVQSSGGFGGGTTVAHSADGGYIRGPGTARSDSIPAMLSNGEYVVNAAATRRNLALLHSINAQKYKDGGLAVRHAASMQRFADGGIAGASRSSNVSAGSEGNAVPLIDYDRLAQSMAGLGIAVQVGIGKSTSAKIVMQGNDTIARRR